MNILLLIPYGSVGGMERLALNFYTFYKSKGYTVKALKIIKLESDIITFGEDELFLSNKDFWEMSPIKRIGFYFSAPFKFRATIKKHNITHSIAFGDMANIFSSLTFTKEFKIASIHALKSVEFQQNNIWNKIFAYGFKSTYTHFNKVVCISKAIKNDLIENCNYKFQNLSVIYNPHDIENIRARSTEKIIESNEIEIFSKPTILFLGRLSLQKAPWHLIRAFQKLKSKAYNLVFIGDGDEGIVSFLNQQVSKFGLQENVFFLGRRKNPYKYIKAAKTLVLSSYYEGTPNVIVEAITLQTPVVSTNCTGGILELMSLKNQFEENLNTITESGVITPNMYKGKLEIPSNNYSFDLFKKEEKLLSEGIVYALENNNQLRETIKQNQEELLSKFQLQRVAENYLTPKL